MGGTFYRGGPSLAPRMNLDVRIDRVTNRVKVTRGVSIYDRPDHPNLAQHGGAYLVGDLPEGLRIVKTGSDPSHFEIAPAVEMTFEHYADLLAQVPLTPV